MYQCLPPPKYAPAGGHTNETTSTEVCLVAKCEQRVSDRENLVRSCSNCCQAAKAPTAEFQSWPQPAKPWERIYRDYAGPFLGKMWLICDDAFSKRPIVMLNVGQTTADHKIDALEQIFAVESLPDTLVTDNGTQFVSCAFEQFCANFDIQHLTSPVFHLASNREGERFTQTFKRGFDEM